MLTSTRKGSNVESGKCTLHKHTTTTTHTHTHNNNHPYTHITTTTHTHTEQNSSYIYIVHIFILKNNSCQSECDLAKYTNRYLRTYIRMYVQLDAANVSINYCISIMYCMEVCLQKCCTPQYTAQLHKSASTSDRLPHLGEVVYGQPKTRLEEMVKVVSHWETRFKCCHDIDKVS